MKLYFFLFQLIFIQSYAQIKSTKPEIFTSGFIDVMNTGQVNASARFIRLFIGEAGKFALPISFYGGVSNNNFVQQQSGGQLVKSNDHLINQYINPMSGLINISVEGIWFSKKKDSAITKFGYIYQIGERVLNGVRVGAVNNPLTGKPTKFFKQLCYYRYILSNRGMGKNQ